MTTTATLPNDSTTYGGESTEQGPCNTRADRLREH